MIVINCNKYHLSVTMNVNSACGQKGLVYTSDASTQEVIFHSENRPDASIRTRIKLFPYLVLMLASGSFSPGRHSYAHACSQACVTRESHANGSTLVVL